MTKENVLRSFTRLNCATGNEVYSFKCSDEYTMKMAVEDYFNVRNFITQHPTLEELKREIISKLKCEYDEENNMFFVEGEWAIFIYYGTFECELDLKLPLVNKIVTYFTRLEETNENK